MDKEETYIMSWISDNLLMLTGLVVLLWILKKCSLDLRRRAFPHFMNYLENKSGKMTREIKKDIFSQLDTLISHEPELRKENAIKILEIGVGTGTNFSFYPDGTRLVVVDPNPHFKNFYNVNRKKFTNIHSEDIIVTTGEEMDMIPDNSVDAVVTTLVLCSVANLEKILQQIHRVLTPGGKYFFYEHIREFDAKQHATRFKFQNLLTESGFWPFFFDGCNLNRDMLATIQHVGFGKVKAQRFYMTYDHKIFQLLNPSLKGVAEK